MRTCRTDPEIVPGLAFAFGVGNQRRYQLQDVLFAMDIGERVAPPEANTPATFNNLAELLLAAPILCVAFELPPKEFLM